MKKNLVLLIGIALLAFSVLGYFGNFVQWRDAQRTTATILSGKEQWTRGGAGNINLDIRYSVDGVPRNKTVQVSASRLGEAEPTGEIEVFYMKKDPDRVIPVAVLTEKQRLIYLTLCAGIVLTVVGAVIRLRKKAAVTE